MSTFSQRFGFSQKLIALAMFAALSPAYAEEEPGGAARAEGGAATVTPAEAEAATVAPAEAEAGSVAPAEEDADIAKLTKPESWVSVGLRGVSGDSRSRALFGEYNGMRDQDLYGLLDFDVIKLDDETGTWTTFQGSHLGLDDRELRFLQQKQGNWKYSVEYSELTRNYPRTINTGMQGAGTTTPTVNLLAAPGTGSDLDLKTKRKSVSLAADKWLIPSLQFEVSFKNEDKDGARLFGKGFACVSAAAPGCLGPTASATGWALLMLPEPIDSTTKQIEAKLNYFAGEKLALSGGYYGSFYTNENGNLTPTVPGTLNNAMGTPLPLSTGLQSILQLPMALPPDNQAHQLYLSGTYGFTPTTRATFKYAYTHATQNEDFASMGLTGAPAGISNLGGVVDTNLAQLGLTARPMPKLSMLANVRYEDKNDKTPIALYNIEGVNTFTNGHLSSKKLAGKLEASYRLPDNYRGTLGVDYESVDRGTFTSTDQVAGLSGLRQKTDETSYRAELRRSMSETLNAAVSYIRSSRDGSNWLKPNSGATTGVTEITNNTAFANTTTGRYVGIFPMMLEDRIREKVKLSADWSLTERLSLQFVVEEGRDKYSAPTVKGLRDSLVHFYSIDAGWTLSETWKLTGYWSHGDQVINVAHSTGYVAALWNRNDTVGLGVVGKPAGRLEVGGDLSYTNDSNRYGQTLDPAASAGNKAFLAQSGGLPDVTFRQAALKLFGKYAVQKNAAIRVDLMHQRTTLNEWTWGNAGVPFTYSDNTTVSMDQHQNVSFIGVAFIYKWQ